MRAAVCTAYGPPEVLQLRTVPDPRPRNKEVCIRLVATAVTASDCIVRGLKMRGVYRPLMRVVFGIRAPRKGIIGMIAAGEIESVGREVTSFKPGDQVFGMDGFRAGTYAEKVCWPASAALALRPANLTYEESAALPYGGLLASFFVRRLKVQKGQRLLVYGASGAIGTSAVQLARHLGAEVTGVCSTANLELVQSLGATTVIDYTKDDFTQSGGRYDLIFDAVGKRKSAKAMVNARAALAPGGVAMSVDDAFPRTTKSDLLVLKELAESGALRSVIDRRYTLDEIVEAHRYVDMGHKKGNVIITISPAA
ncbi:MAG TPA: NAD(P)-dependent alcohol dehydrogenase [Candidatus Dormibacteraeota bacterium]|jgi:NADPH:quinone reductase-like Zn-dependent oxidoreductase|nr:NAD(P)-dependent alcohol dehydrogenase [Candidatus Dormibacteraeota bacterium]